MIGTFCWNELMTRDREKALAFYSNLFGWETKQSPLHEGYSVIVSGGKDIGGIMQMGSEFPADTKPHWMPYVAVADVDKVAEEGEGVGWYGLRSANGHSQRRAFRCHHRPDRCDPQHHHAGERPEVAFYKRKRRGTMRRDERFATHDSESGVYHVTYRRASPAASWLRNSNLLTLTP
jgi:catechol 2,3-dioxygenase-like lactoylglutathione lyase family enzyme